MAAAPTQPAPPSGPQPTGKQNLSAFICSVADLLRGDYKQSDYGKVILPFTVLRRLDCVLAPSKAAVLEEKTLREGQGLDPMPFLLRKAGQNFCNTSALDMKRLMGDQDNIGENLHSTIQAFTPEVRDIFERFEFHLQVDRLEKAGLLYMVAERFAQIDLHPETVCNAEMGLVFEELIRKFAELSNETAGEHLTPGEVIRLMMNLIFIEDDDALTQPGIVLNGSPLFTGGAGSGESEIRRYVLENDLLEAIIALPTDMFYNTGISTHVWVLSNRKPEERKGKVQLIDASSFWQKMRKSLGSKRKELSPEHIEEITQLFGAFEEAEQDGKPISKIFRNEDFGYRTITVERPLRDEAGNVVLGQRGKAKGQPQADSSLRDTENVPLSEDVHANFEREVLPHVPDAWIDHDKTKVGYEIPFNRHLYVFTPPRPLEVIDAELKQVTNRILAMIGSLSA